MLTRPINAKGEQVALSKHSKERKFSVHKLTECEIIDKRPSTDLHDREKNLRKFGHIPYSLKFSRVKIFEVQ